MADSCDYTPLAIIGIVLLVLLAIWILCYVITSLVRDNRLGNVVSNILFIILYIWIIYAYSMMWLDGQHVTVVLVILFILVLLNLPWIIYGW